MGSPPRVREKPTVILTDDQALRITPACAGKTKALKLYPGSPPLLREKPRFLFQRSEANGINPTSAGKTQPFKRSFS